MKPETTSNNCSSGKKSRTLISTSNLCSSSKTISKTCDHDSTRWLWNTDSFTRSSRTTSCRCRLWNRRPGNWLSSRDCSVRRSSCVWDSSTRVWNWWLSAWCILGSSISTPTDWRKWKRELSIWWRHSRTQWVRSREEVWTFLILITEQSKLTWFSIQVKLWKLPRICVTYSIIHINNYQVKKSINLCL